ncbi:type IV secretory system conjugative DNA transfer family protein [Acinetobacter gyllenbergii]|uniref:type IV secretory system conjugative DNA transfer family protein n=1 Tax=Acinetobacter gyllenbergii TaxID=134534 RepID=UPI003F57CC3C
MADLPNYQYYLEQTPIIVSQSDSSKQAENTARVEAIQTIVREAATRNALRARLQEISNVIKTNDRKLDTVYNFQPLMINTIVVPPVIIEAHNISDVTSARTFSVLGTRYEIKENARFSHLPPNWRDYLNFNIESYQVGVDSLPNELKPKNNQEKQAFKKAMDQGVEDGVKEADAIFSHQLNRLNQAYIGMLKFHQFRLNGKITMPVIARSNISLAGGSNAMMLNQSNFQITELPRFVNEPAYWKANTLSVVSRSEVQKPVPASTSEEPIKDSETPVAIETQ